MCVLSDIIEFFFPSNLDIIMQVWMMFLIIMFFIVISIVINYCDWGIWCKFGVTSLLFVICFLFVLFPWVSFYRYFDDIVGLLFFILTILYFMFFLWSVWVKTPWSKIWKGIIITIFAFIFLPYAFESIALMV